MREYANVFYVGRISKIGGIETSIYELAKKYDYEIVLLYKQIDSNQLKRLLNLIPCIPYTKQQIKCKRLFVANHNFDILDTCQADEKIQVIHGMYKTCNIKPIIDNRINRRIAVSEVVANEYYDLTGIKPEIYYNPITIENNDKLPVLYLISATRLSSEKGGDRMIKLAQLLEINNIRYVWLVFTDDETYEFTNNVVKINPTLDIRPYIASIKGKGYGVQLSDGEGDCYFTKECKALGVPVLITPVASFKEQGWKNKENCYVLPFDMSNINIEEIVNKIPKVNQLIEEDKWNELLIHKETNYKKEMNKMFKVKALSAFQEHGLAPIELGKDNIPKEGQEFIVDKKRLEILLGNNSYNVPFVEIVEEIKEEPETINEKPKKTNKKK